MGFPRGAKARLPVRDVFVELSGVLPGGVRLATGRKASRFVRAELYVCTRRTFAVRSLWPSHSLILSLDRFIGHPGATGGNWEYKAGSARVVWQRDGIAAVYLYLPLQVAFDGSKEMAVDTQSD